MFGKLYASDEGDPVSPRRAASVAQGDRSNLWRQAYVQGANMVAENARKWWSIPSDDSGHSLDDWLKAIEVWATGPMYADMPLFPGEAAVMAVVEHLQEAAAGLFPGLPHCELRRHIDAPGKFWLHFQSATLGDERGAAMLVRVEFSDSDFVGMDRKVAISFVRTRVLKSTSRAFGGI